MERLPMSNNEKNVANIASLLKQSDVLLSSLFKKMRPDVLKRYKKQLDQNDSIGASEQIWGRNLIDDIIETKKHR